MYKHFLVATDGSALSKKAVRSAIDLAISLDAQLTVLNVVPRYPISYYEGGMVVSMDDVARTEKLWSDDAQNLVNVVRDAAMTKGIKAKGIVMQSGEVAESIIAAAKKHKCDLVVMASHGRKGIKRVLLGSETLHVLTHSTVPVLVLR